MIHVCLIFTLFLLCFWSLPTSVALQLLNAVFINQSLTLTFGLKQILCGGFLPAGCILHVNIFPLGCTCANTVNKVILVVIRDNKIWLHLVSLESYRDKTPFLYSVLKVLFNSTFPEVSDCNSTALCDV